jgi:flagellin
MPSFLEGSFRGVAYIRGISGISPARTLSLEAIEIERRIARLSSGERIGRAGDDAAGFSVSESLRAQISGRRIEIRNIQDLISRNQVAEGALGEVGDIVGRIRKLAVQASAETLSTESRQLIQQEIESLRSEVNRIARGTEFNGEPVIAEIGTKRLAEVDVRTASGAQEAIEEAGGFLDEITSTRASLGAQTNRLQSEVRGLSSEELSLTAAQSRIRSADVAEEAIGLTLSQLRSRAGASVLAQANVLSQNVLKLLG